MNIFDSPITDSAPPSLGQARRAFERDYLVRVLRMTRGNVTNAARIAGRNRTEFYRLLDRHSLSPGMFKPSWRGDAAVAGASADPAPPALSS
jgi:two-component system, NtrC family, response regulator GlrR